MFKRYCKSNSKWNNIFPQKQIRSGIGYVVRLRSLVIDHWKWSVLKRVSKVNADKPCALRFAKEMTRELTTFENWTRSSLDFCRMGKISLEKRWFLFPPRERTESVVAVSKRAAPVHALFYCQKLFPLEIYRSGENRGVISGPNETKKASDPTRAKDNWRAILSCPFSLSRTFLAIPGNHHHAIPADFFPEQLYGCASWRLLNVPTARLIYSPGGFRSGETWIFIVPFRRCGK